jgi:phage-related protein
MGGLIESVGNGISSLISGAFDAIGAALRGIVNAGNQALPGGLLFFVVFVALIGGAWYLAKK